MFFSLFIRVSTFPGFEAPSGAFSFQSASRGAILESQGSLEGAQGCSKARPGRSWGTPGGLFWRPWASFRAPRCLFRVNLAAFEGQFSKCGGPKADFSICFVNFIVFNQQITKKNMVPCLSPSFFPTSLSPVSLQSSSYRSIQSSNMGLAECAERLNKYIWNQKYTF